MIILVIFIANADILIPPTLNTLCCSKGEDIATIHMQNVMCEVREIPYFAKLIERVVLLQDVFQVQLMILRTAILQLIFGVWLDIKLLSI